MNLDSIFDQALRKADQAVEDVLASKFVLFLKDGTSLELKAIFDSKLMPQDNTQNRQSVIAEKGALTVLNQRVPKSLVTAAAVDTPLGQRYVVDVLYQDESTSILILSTKPSGQRVSPSDNFL